MRSQSNAYVLGIVAMVAGVATLAFSLSRLIDSFGAAAVVCGLGATAWASGGTSLLKKYTAALLIAALIGGALVLIKLMSGR
jgi:hypothetical protein